MGSWTSCLMDCSSPVGKAMSQWVSGRPVVSAGVRGNGRLSTLGRNRCELIVGVDFTKSNEFNGRDSFGGKCLHDVDGTDNPYTQVLNLSARTLDVYDSDHRIPCYGFGDCRTGSQAVFSFFERNQPAIGLEALLKRYKEIVPCVDMSGPTSFAPLIRQALKDVYDSGMKFHILLIIADGQVSQEYMEETQQAIIDACDFPLSIVVIGVGDGPWEEMERFDAGLPERPWDNFRFCQFDRAVNAAGTAASDRESCFESNVLQELSDHYEQARTRTGAANRQRVSRFVREKLGAAPFDPPSRC